MSLPVYLWLCCEGWMRFGPYESLHFDAKHNIVTDEGEKVAYCVRSYFDFNWHTPGEYQGFCWERPVITTACCEPYADRVYIIHAPAGFTQACNNIRQSCERACVIPDDGSEWSRRQVVEQTLREAELADPTLRLSVYTRDETLARLLEPFEPWLASQLAYFGVHRISRRGPRMPWMTSRWRHC